MSKAVVLLSGGQDSATVFHLALREHEVTAVIFDYGQRHKIEIQLAEEIASKAGCPWVVVPMPALSMMSASSLTNAGIANTGEGESENTFARERGLPASFTPGRNLLFFTVGAAIAAGIGATKLYTGVCQQDRSGYPDCRGEFVAYMQEAIRSGFDWPQFEIVAPLLRLNKEDTWHLADMLDVLEQIKLETNSCYEGDREILHVWGYGCGECGACVERAKGYSDYAWGLKYQKDRA